jgi:hypothetical protein
MPREVPLMRARGMGRRDKRTGIRDKRSRGVKLRIKN